MQVVGAGTRQQPRRRAAIRDRTGYVAQDLAHLLGIRARRFRCGLRAPQLRGSDHLHGFGDLLGRFGRRNANPHVLEAGHVSYRASSAYLALRCDEPRHIRFPGAQICGDL